MDAVTQYPATKYLLDARASGRRLADLPPEAQPRTREEAYAIQDAVIDALGAVGGWKVSPVPEGGEPSCAPILAADILPGGAELPREKLPDAAIEVEIAVVLGRDLPAGARTAEIIAAIDTLRVALEVLSSRYLDRKAVPQLAGFADMQSNAAVVLGEAHRFDSLPELAGWPMSLVIDGGAPILNPGGAGTDNVLAALEWLARHAASRNRPLKAGQVIITGARVGPQSTDGRVIVGTAQGLGEVVAKLV